MFFSALNNSVHTPQSLVKCDSSRKGDVLIVVTVAIATLLAAAVVALVVMLFKIRRMKLHAAPENQ